MSIRFELLRSFGPFESLTTATLPKFAVITGLNGAGKTSLFRAIAQGIVQVRIDDTVIPKSEILMVATGLSASLRLQGKYDNAVGLEEKIATGLLNRHKPGQQGGSRARVETIVNRTAKMLSKGADDLIGDDVRAFAASESYAKGTEGFAVALGQASMGFLRNHWFREKAKWHYEQRGDPSYAALATLPEDARPPPWVLASKVLEPFGFTIEGPEVTMAAAERDVELVLRDGEGRPVPPDHLSGGEKALAAVALAQYVLVHGVGFPRLLLLDESLSSVHPSIAGKALDAVRRTLVQEQGIHVLLATHSPTIVALSPEEAVFVARNNRPLLEIEATGRDTALGLLTHGVPTMRIEIDNRRQVYVESRQDEFIYSRLYEALRHVWPGLRSEYSLEFLRSADPTGSKSHVLRAVAGLRGAGVRTVRGLIDWDLDDSEASTDGVHILAKGERYGIENLMLDPLLLALALAETVPGRHLLNVSSRRELTNSPHDVLQSKAILALRQVAAKSGRGEDLTTTPVSIEYVGGFSIEVPHWALTTRCHDYAEWVDQAYPFLRARFRDGPNNSHADKLVAAIASQLAVEVPDYLPVCIAEVFAALSKPDGPVD